MKLYLVRHAKPLIAPGICYGASDVSCSDELMKTEAYDLLNTLPKELEIISSPLSRCERLTQYLCGLESKFAYKTDAKLAEMHFGAWEMQPWADVAASELTAWTAAFATYRCGGSGESTAQFVGRVAQRLHASWQGEEDQIWITHAGVIRALQWLSTQPFDLFIELASRPDPARLLGRLHAADWPAGEVAYCRVQQWGWPMKWPSSSPLWLPQAVLGSR